MIVSTGIDIIEVYRIRDAIARTPRFAERVFTVAETEYCESKGAAAAQSYAGRYAAKEAFFKALKTGWRGKITWQDVEVVNDNNGTPSLNISGEAEDLLNALGADRVHVSLPHTAEHAGATVVLESNK
jgi:holo-[acyl-carrier protein] synthase